MSGPTSYEARVEAVVHGRVQGVGFRVFAARTARRLGVTGWVANEPSGRVRCVAEGPLRALEQLLEGLRAGPPGTFVERVDAEWPAPTGEFSRFEIRSGWHPGD